MFEAAAGPSLVAAFVTNAGNVEEAEPELGSLLRVAANQHCCCFVVPSEQLERMVPLLAAVLLVGQSERFADVIGPPAHWPRASWSADD